MSKVDLITKINKTIVHEDGTIDSFDRQLLDLTSGIYDTKYPFVIKVDTRSLEYIDSIDANKPLIMMVSTAVKIREKHDIGYSYVSRVNELLERSAFAFESLVHENSFVIVLGEFDEKNNPIIAICRSNKNIGYIGVNEVTSLYDRDKFINLLHRTYLANKMFYINDKTKTEQFINSFQFQVLDDLKIALSIRYYSKSFNKNQVIDALACEGVVVDENEEYLLVHCSDDSYEIRDVDDNYIANTEFDNLEEALDELQKQSVLSI